MITFTQYSICRSNSISLDNIENYKPFLNNLIDDVLLDSNSDNEMLVFYYSTSGDSNYIDSNVWTSGDSNHVQQYKNTVSNHLFSRGSATVSQQAWRAADLAFESKFSEPSGEYEEIVVIVGDGMPRRQFNMHIDDDNKWRWYTDGDTRTDKQKGTVTRNRVELYVMLENIFETLSRCIFNHFTHILITSQEYQAHR